MIILEHYDMGVTDYARARLPVSIRICSQTTKRKRLCPPLHPFEKNHFPHFSHYFWFVWLAMMISKALTTATVLATLLQINGFSAVASPPDTAG